MILEGISVCIVLLLGDGDAEAELLFQLYFSHVSQPKSQINLEVIQESIHYSSKNQF